MSSNLNPKMDRTQPMVYEIKVECRLRRQWTDWFDGVAITLEDTDNTVPTGPVVDQAALYRMPKKVRDLGMPLVSLNRVEAGSTDAPRVKQ